MALELSVSAKTVKVTSAAFREGNAIPARFSCEGADVNPSLGLDGVPTGAAALALIMDDPDAPGGTFTHWTVWNLPASTRKVPENARVQDLGGREGRNDFGKTGYGGPCPPSGTHRYFFRVFALDAVLELAGGAPLAQLEKALQGHVVAWGALVGTYQKG